ncbi:unnamed protein product [Ostreobium quekettii]|uniref:protein-serine/threonine phosphatase n=1 Tax=Ostreobium quekettii TaxID=121088 RepID=A0A8S1INE2_9CHLO|nr:unnamed protein product [Ostreobium quekettii]
MGESWQDEHNRHGSECVSALFGAERASLMLRMRTAYSTCQRRVKGEDVALAREGLTKEAGGPTWSLYGICDGHGGAVAANYVTGNMWRALRPRLPAAPPNHASAEDFDAFGRQVRAAVVAAFTSIGAQFERDVAADTSGTSVTLAVLCGRLLTVANLGDSDAVLDTGSDAILATVGRRSEDVVDEPSGAVDLAKATGLAEQSDVGQRGLKGQLRSRGPFRSIGDLYASKPVCHSPHVFQAWVPMNGVRMTIGSAGLWDLTHWKQAARTTSRTPITTCAAKVVADAETQHRRPIANDVTALVVDMLPEQTSSYTMKRNGSKFGLHLNHWIACLIHSCLTRPEGVGGVLADRRLRVIARVDGRDIVQESQGACMESAVGQEFALRTPTISPPRDLAFMLAHEISLCRPLRPFRTSMQEDMLSVRSSFEVTDRPVAAPCGPHEHRRWSNDMPRKSQYAPRGSEYLPSWSGSRPGELSANSMRGGAAHAHAASCDDPCLQSLGCSRPRWSSDQDSWSCGADMAAVSCQIHTDREMLCKAAAAYNSSALSIRTTLAQGQTYGCGVYEDARGGYMDETDVSRRRSVHKRRLPSDQGIPSLKELLTDSTILPRTVPDQPRAPFRASLDDRLETLREQWWRGELLGSRNLTSKALLPLASSRNSWAACTATMGPHPDRELLENMYGSRSDDEASFSGWTPADPENFHSEGEADSTALPRVESLASGGRDVGCQ